MNSDLLKTHRALVLLVDFKNCNPQGDPDRENEPRTDDETGHGIITVSGPKRKIRDYLALRGHNIYVRRGACFETQNNVVFGELGLGAPPPVDGADDEDEIVEDEAPKAKGKGAKAKAKGGSKKPEKKGRMTLEDANRVYASLCAKYIDARLFGQSVPGLPGTARGPVQFSMGESIDPVQPVRASITRVAVATEKEAADQGGSNRMMGGVWYIPYGLYRFHIYVNPSDARVTGCTEADYETFIEALVAMFDHDRSSGRATSCVRALYEFRMNEQMRGPVHAEKLLESITVRRRDKDSKARSFADYEVYVPQAVQSSPDFTFRRIVSETNPWLDQDAVAAE